MGLLGLMWESNIPPYSVHLFLARMFECLTKNFNLFIFKVLIIVGIANFKIGPKILPLLFELCGIACNIHK
ncbi:hypothetical protein I79_026228 [Cricetulus griseus]|uniref:Uncharacterized protein n=1 Tax=Cricetulus griseus TaxID=10029 RepID=G3IQB6_CRIGR|nr:hypothetical protein I79_026228 [Cricetulus griseus]